MNPEEYAKELVAEDEVLRQVRERSEAAGLPTIAVNPVYGRLLTLLVAASGAGRALEIGTLGGYSAVCIARGLGSGGRLLSLEIDEAHAEVARQNLQQAGVADRVEVRVGEAHASLAELERQSESFDFFFVDADKESYPDYLEGALRLARPGALIAADNALYHGRVLDPQDGSDSARALRSFTRAVMSHPRLTAVMLPAFDGLILARVNPSVEL
jgi:caffeoyl-CoA O-methyltransferase